MQDNNAWKPFAIIFGIVAVLTFGYIQRQRMNEPPEDEWFMGSVIEYPGVVVVKFGAEWCGPCRSMHQSLSRFKGRIGGVKVVEVDVDERPHLAAHYGVRSIPRTLIFVDGKYQTGITGSRSVDDLEAWVRPYADQRIAAQ